MTRSHATVRFSFLAMLPALATLALPTSVVLAGTQALGAFEQTRPAQATPAADSEMLVGFPQYPSLSPDGTLIAFSWAGDLWLVNRTGGVASRLTTHPAIDRRSAFAPDGHSIAFESERDGGRNLYVMTLDDSAGRRVAGAPSQMTSTDRSHTLSGFAADGRSLLSSGALEPSIYRHARMYATPIRSDGTGGPTTRMTDAFGMLQRQSPNGSRVVFMRGRFGFERPHYTGSGAMDVFEFNPAAGSFAQLTTHPANDGEASALPDGSTVFISSRDGQNNIWKLEPGAADDNAATQLTSFKPTDAEGTIGHGVRDLCTSFDGRWASFCVWDTLYVLDLKQRNAKAVPVVIRASADDRALEETRIDLSREVTEAALSPDGKTMAVVARGEVLVRNIEEDHPTRRVTHSIAREADLAWSPDNQFLYFTCDLGDRVVIKRAAVTLTRDDVRKSASPEPEADDDAEEQAEADEQSEDDPESAAEDGDEDDKDKDEEDDTVSHGARWADAVRLADEVIVEDGIIARRPMPSPDGKLLLYTRGEGDLVLVNLADQSRRTILESWDQPEVIWAPDSRHLVYAVADLNFNSDIWIVDAQSDDLTPHNITQHPDIDHEPRLSADGKVLVFLSERAGVNWEWDIWRINLDESLDGMTAIELAKYYKDAAKAASDRKPLAASAPDDDDADGAEDSDDDDKKDKEPAPLVLDLDDAHLRAHRVTRIEGSESNLALTPGADRIVFQVERDGDSALVSVDSKGKDEKSIHSGSVSSVTVSLTGDKVVFVNGSQARTAPPAGGKSETVAVDARIRVDLAQQQRQKFLQAARIVGDRFYHPTLKGLNWPLLTERYTSLATRTRTAEAFNRIGNMLFGELDGSHLGIWGGDQFSPPSTQVGYLGATTEPAPGGFLVTHIAKGSPADRSSSRLDAGDLIVAINDTSLAPKGGMPTVDLTMALTGTSGQETLLEVLGQDMRQRFVLIEPVGFAAWRNLAYDDEVARRRALVEAQSNGRLGYLHIRSMNLPGVRDFERDLYAAAHGRDGLIIDVRDNGGGFTTDILLASLTAPVHAYTIPRGADPDEVPRDAYPRDRRLIYGYAKPLVVLINENSFSNAEIFAHAIKTTGRGRLIGTPTFGGVISTGGTRLIDGTSVRIPFRGWYLPDGSDMESNGARPDVAVAQTPADEARGHDAQLQAATSDLLQTITSGR